MSKNSQADFPIKGVNPMVKKSVEGEKRIQNLKVVSCSITYFITFIPYAIEKCIK